MSDSKKLIPNSQPQIDSAVSPSTIGSRTSAAIEPSDPHFSASKISAFGTSESGEMSHNLNGDFSSL